MNKKFFMMAVAAGCLVFGSCASKKDLENCQNENKELTRNYQDSKEQLAASKARSTRAWLMPDRTISA